MELKSYTLCTKVKTFTFCHAIRILYLIAIILSLDVDISKLNPVFIQMLALQRIKQLLPSTAKTEPPCVKSEPSPTMEVDTAETKSGEFPLEGLSAKLLKYGC